MRVLHVVARDHRRGSELFACDLMTALSRAGIEQNVLVLRPTPNPLTFPAPTTRVPGGVLSLPLFRLPVRRISALRRAVQRFAPEVIHAHGGEALKTVFFSTTRVPFIYRRIGSVGEYLEGRLRQEVYGALMRRAARAVATAQALRRELIEIFRVDPARAVTIPRGVDPDRINVVKGRVATRKELGIDPETPVVLTLGALSWEKDPLGQLEVARSITSRRRAAFVLAGDGPMRAEVERRAAGMPSVLILGGRTDVGDLLCAADVLLMTSLTEGMPGALVESAIAGVPAVAYDVGGIGEVVRDAETGYLAARGDCSTLVSHLIRLLDDAELRTSMGQAARRWGRDRFDIATISDQYISLYEEVVLEGAVIDR